jgi:hypothetical protein
MHIGFKHSEETKEKIRQKRLGTKHTKETLEKMHEGRKGKNNVRWNGGKRFHNNGYIEASAPEHPHKSKSGYVLEHRLVMEKYLGRFLKRKEIVHHINENPSDNRLENLMIFPNITAHLNYHRKYLGM